MRLPVCALAVVLAGCTLDTDYFSEYRGTNLLGNWGFDTGNWDLEVGTEFMTWEPTGEAHDGHPAYRLEIKNLIPNGDFEDESVTPDSGPSTTVPTNWSRLGGAVTFAATHDSVSLTGRSMRWEAPGGSSLLLDLGAAIGAAWQPSNSYRVRFDFAELGATGLVNINLVETFPESLGQETLAEVGGRWAQTSLQKAVVYGFSKKFDQPETLENRFLVWGALKGSEATDMMVDNVRVFLDTGNRSVATSLPSLDSGTLTLLPGEKPGMYRFTLWVKDDATANNRFQATKVSISVVAAVKSGSGTPSPVVFERPSGGWSTWTALTMDFGFDFVSDDDDLEGQPALAINITPMGLGTDAEAADVGSILVAHPTLTFNP